MGALASARSMVAPKARLLTSSLWFVSTVSESFSSWERTDMAEVNVKYLEMSRVYDEIEGEFRWEDKGEVVV